MTLLAIVAGGGAATAGAAVVSGSNLAGTATPGAAFCAASLSCTVAIADLPPATSAPGGPRAAIDGVIVSWRLKTASGPEAQSIRLRLVRNNTGAGSGSVVILPKFGGTYEFPANLPVKANDRIGVDLVNPTGSGGVSAFRQLEGAPMNYWIPPLGEGEMRGPTAGAGNYEMLINATIEPDADGDGYGDESQDKCPTAAGQSAGCPPAVPPPIPTEPEPNTQVSEVRVEGAKAVFRFSATVNGAKFSCKLDKKPWKSCKSPKVYRGLKAGRHKFKVKAIGPTAVPDPTPAKRSFKVKL